MDLARSLLCAALLAPAHVEAQRTVTLPPADASLAGRMEPRYSIGKMPSPCSCGVQLVALAGATSSNYAGFRDKAGNPADSLRHAQYLGILRERAARSMGADCVAVLESYIAYFQDRHLQVRFTEAGALLGSVPGMGSMPRLHADAAATVSRGTSDHSDPIVGEWESTSGRTRLRIVRAPPPYDASDRYALVVASPDTAWHQADVYATFVLDEHRGVYHATWYAPGRHPQKWSAVVVGDTLLLSGFNGWHRVTAETAGIPTARRDPLRPSFRMTAPAAAVLALPSMQVQYAAEVDRLLRVNADAISRLELLIIDVRGNQGGGDGTYMPILPLLFTDTIVIGAGSVLSAPAIISYYEQFLDPAGVNSPAWVVDMLAAMRAEPGRQIPLPELRLAYDRILPAPPHVAILTDATGASSTETFLLRALQSGKVRIFGQPTAGIVDYLNPAHHPIGCGVTLQAPTIRRAEQLPEGAIDGHGIAPQVVLPWSEQHPFRVILASYGLAPS